MSDSKCEECSSHEKCGNRCGHGFNCVRGFYFIRWILGLIILATIFCVGILIGRFASQIERSGGYANYGGGYYRMMQLDDNYSYAPFMMRGIQTTDTISASATKTATK